MPQIDLLEIWSWKSRVWLYRTQNLLRVRQKGFALTRPLWGPSTLLSGSRVDKTSSPLQSHYIPIVIKANSGSSIPTWFLGCEHSKPKPAWMLHSFLQHHLLRASAEQTLIQPHTSPPGIYTVKERLNTVKKSKLMVHQRRPVV